MKAETRATSSGIRRSSSSWLAERDQLGVRQQLGQEPAELGRVDLVALDRDDDGRRRDVAQQLPVRDRPVLDHPVDRTGKPVGIVVLPQHAVELQAPRRLDVLGHAGRIVQHGLERLLRASCPPGPRQAGGSGSPARTAGPARPAGARPSARTGRGRGTRGSRSRPRRARSPRRPSRRTRPPRHRRRARSPRTGTPSGPRGELERPCPRKSNLTLVPGTSGVKAASSLRLFVSPCAKTVTGSPSPSTSQNSVASSLRTSGTSPTYRSPGRTMRRDGRRHRDAQGGRGPDAVRRGRARGRRHDRARRHRVRSGPRAARGGQVARGVRPRLLRVPARTRAEGVDPVVVRRRA